MALNRYHAILGIRKFGNCRSKGRGEEWGEGGCGYLRCCRRCIGKRLAEGGEDRPDRTPFVSGNESPGRRTYKPQPVFISPRVFLPCQPLPLKLPPSMEQENCNFHFHVSLPTNPTPAQTRPIARSLREVLETVIKCVFLEL